jgi:hypothetical protein
MRGNTTEGVAQVEPQPYGRSGGYVGADRIAGRGSAGGEGSWATGVPLRNRWVGVPPGGRFERLVSKSLVTLNLASRHLVCQCLSRS